MITIIDVSGTNLSSLGNTLNRLGFDYIFSHKAEEIQKASHVILPGVGSAAFGMHALEQAGLLPVLAQLKQPVLGICLGMQLLFEFSDEGQVPCLGLIPGRVEKLSPKHYPVPHMGWNQLHWLEQSTLRQGLSTTDYVYFTHSYAVKNTPACLAECEYGETFAAIVQQDNLFGMQFHPEKSSEVGMMLFKNFCLQ
ncbi:MAG: imidazole glycerol phosphate synthase subunit HisH [Legionella sp.]|jgi:glutamine amidotransferase